MGNESNAKVPTAACVCVCVWQVATQLELEDEWTLRKWIKYMETPFETRDAILNLISLEFSKTALARVVQPPAFVQQIGWAERLWPKAKRAKLTYVCNVPYVCVYV